MHQHNSTTFELPPRHSDAPTPRVIIGHDYEAFCRLYTKFWKARYVARAENRPFAAKFKDETDELIFLSSLKKLRDQGIIVDGLEDNKPVFRHRLKSPQELMFENGQEVNGVPTLKALKKMSVSECIGVDKEARKQWGG